jgi:Family of unknown function (DUF6011)
MNLATEKNPVDFFDIPEDDLGPISTPTNAHKKPGRFTKRAPTDRAEELFTEKCRKCGGAGIYRGYSTYGSQCFACNGKGVLTFKTPRAKRDAAKIKSAERKAKKLDDNLAAFEAEHPQIAAWWTDSTFPFALSLREGARKYGSLTSGQLNAALKCVEKFSAAKEAMEARDAAVTIEAKPVDISPVVNSLRRAKLKGLQYPKMHLLGEGRKLVFSLAPAHGKNAGAVYVKESSEDGRYLGKIADGKFFKSYECNDASVKAVEAACADPENAAIAYGKTFGVCSCCNRDLSDPVSVARGIGPVCADKFFG